MIFYRAIPDPTDSLLPKRNTSDLPIEALILKSNLFKRFRRLSIASIKFLPTDVTLQNHLL